MITTIEPVWVVHDTTTERVWVATFATKELATVYLDLNSLSEHPRRLEITPFMSQVPMGGADQ